MRPDSCIRRQNKMPIIDIKNTVFQLKNGTVFGKKTPAGNSDTSGYNRNTERLPTITGHSRRGYPPAIVSSEEHFNS